MAADINNTVLQGGSFIGGVGEGGSGRKVGRAQAGEWMVVVVLVGGGTRGK